MLTRTVTRKQLVKATMAIRILRHHRRERMHLAEHAALALGHRQTPGERGATVPVTNPKNAPLAVARFQNMPSRNVANSGALTKPRRLQQVHDVV